MNNESPYHPPNSIPTLQFRSKDDCSVIIYLTVAITAIAKWFLPAVLGTGGIMTLGTWVEELVVVTALGFACGLSKSPAIVYQPFNYFLIGYILPFPLLIRDQFFLLVYVFGIIACVFLYLGIFVGVVGRTIFEKSNGSL